MGIETSFCHLSQAWAKDYFPSPFVFSCRSSQRCHPEMKKNTLGNHIMVRTPESRMLLADCEQIKGVGVWHWHMLPASDWVSSHLYSRKEDYFSFVHKLKPNAPAGCVRGALHAYGGGAVNVCFCLQWKEEDGYFSWHLWPASVSVTNNCLYKQDGRAKDGLWQPRHRHP